MFGLLFSVRGRISRSTYLCLGVGTRVGAAGFAALIESGWAPSLNILFALAFPLGAIAFLLCGWISFAASVKRLHDQDKSGWWLLSEIPVFWLVYSVFLILFAGFEPSGWAAFVVSSLVLGRRAGSPGANRFGPKPPSFLRRALSRKDAVVRALPDPVPSPPVPVVPDQVRGPIKTHPRRHGGFAVVLVLVAVAAIGGAQIISSQIGQVDAVLQPISKP